MSRFNYTKRQTRASAMLAKYGTPVVISRTASNGDVTTQTVNAVYEKRELYTNFLASDTSFGGGGSSSVEMGDWKILLAAKDENGVAVDPQHGDRLIDGDDSFVIVNPTPIKPGGTVIAHYVWGRRG